MVPACSSGPLINVYHTRTPHPRHNIDTGRSVVMLFIDVECHSGKLNYPFRCLGSDLIRLQVKLYDKRDDFNFDIVNFPFLSSNIPKSPAYGFFVSQLIRYARASSLYEDFIMRSQLLTSKLLEQGFTRNRLIATFKKFYGRHGVLVDRFKVSVTNIIIDLFLETIYH